MPVETEYRAVCARGNYWDGYCKWRSETYSLKKNARAALAIHTSEEHGKGASR